MFPVKSKWYRRFLSSEEDQTLCIRLNSEEFERIKVEICKTAFVLNFEQKCSAYQIPRRYFLRNLIVYVAQI